MLQCVCQGHFQEYPGGGLEEPSQREWLYYFIEKVYIIQFQCKWF